MERTILELRREQIETMPSDQCRSAHPFADDLTPKVGCIILCSNLLGNSATNLSLWHRSVQTPHHGEDTHCGEGPHLTSGSRDFPRYIF